MRKFLSMIVACLAAFAASTYASDSRVDNVVDPYGNMFLQFVAPSATAVNNCVLQNSATGNAPLLKVVGTDTNVGLTVNSKGTGSLILSTATNGVTISNAGTGQPTAITASGSDSNISLNLVPKGSGQVTNNGTPIPTTINLSFPLNATSLAAATDIFVADRAYTVTNIQECHSVVSSGGASVKIRKITDTSAPGAAASSTVKELIDATNSTASALDLTSTINTIKAAAAHVLSLTASDLQLNAGDRIALFPASAPTGYVGTITITLQAR